MPKILVADDNSNIQKMVAAALKDQGIDVVSVANGEAAIKKMADLKPDMILADVFMPVRDGYELCEWVKNNEAFTNIPVFLLVGAFDPLDEHRVKTVRADGVLKKPFVPPDRLIMAVEAMLARSAQAKATEALRETHHEFAASVPHTEETQKLSDTEIAQMTGKTAPAASAPPAPEPEPEMDIYSTRPKAVEFDAGEQPVAFGDLLDRDTEEAEPEAPAFHASSVTGQDAPRYQEAEEPRSYDIVEEQRKPSPDEPPIKVDFGPPEPVELVTEDTRAETAAAHVETGSLPDLVASGHDVAAAPPRVPPPPAVVPEMEVSAELGAPEPPPAAIPMPPVPGSPGSSDVNPYVVDEIVDRILSRLQPQIVHQITTEVGKAISELNPQVIERVTKEMVRPLAEELLRNAKK